MNERRLALEQALEQAPEWPSRLPKKPYGQGVPRLAAAQETWYSLAALRERVATTLSIARERMRHAEDDLGSSSSRATRRSWTARPRGSPLRRRSCPASLRRGRRRCRLQRPSEVPARMPNRQRRTGWRRSSVPPLTGAKDWRGSTDR